ncbi:MAG: hypothetical protein GKR90_21805 [Pseudomonadales bacterium]|nr:hypothetical protein [Pseudomonadales bacterium]
MALSPARENRSVLLLVSPPAQGTFHNDNHERLSLALEKRGLLVHHQPHNKLCLNNGIPHIGTYPLDAFELIWPVGFGPQQGYLDRLAILSLVEDSRFVSPPRTVFSLHNKSHWLEFAPETHMSNNSALLADIVAQGGHWVLKPATGSFGREVERVASAEEIYLRMADSASAYWLLQRYIGAIKDGEYRTIIAGNNIIGTYLRKPRDGFHANLSQEATAYATELPESHEGVVAATHQALQDARIGFAAIDTCGGYVLEVNVANPGGLSTLDGLYGGRSADLVVDSIVS